jgi:hypothetical protein
MMWQLMGVARDVLSIGFLFFVVPWLALTLTLYPLLVKVARGTDPSFSWFLLPLSPTLLLLWTFLSWLGMKFFRHN